MLCVSIMLLWSHLQMDLFLIFAYPFSWHFPLSVSASQCLVIIVIGWQPHAPCLVLVMCKSLWFPVVEECPSLLICFPLELDFCFVCFLAALSVGCVGLWNRPSGIYRELSSHRSGWARAAHGFFVSVVHGVLCVGGPCINVLWIDVL